MIRAHEREWRERPQSELQEQIGKWRDEMAPLPRREAVSALDRIRFNLMGIVCAAAAQLCQRAEAMPSSTRAVSCALTWSSLRTISSTASVQPPQRPPAPQADWTWPVVTAPVRTARRIFFAFQSRANPQLRALSLLQRNLERQVAGGLPWKTRKLLLPHIRVALLK